MGALVGLGLPLWMRILKDGLDVGDLVSKGLTLDYVGALAASLLFPLLLVPHLGLIRTGFAFGLANVAVGIALFLMLPARRLRGDLWVATLASALVAAGFCVSPPLRGSPGGAPFPRPVLHFWFFITSATARRI